MERHPHQDRLELLRAIARDAAAAPPAVGEGVSWSRSAAAAQQSRLERLRQLRVRPAANRSASVLFLRAQADLVRARRASGGVAEAWIAVCPAALLSRTTIVSFRRGALRVAVHDASAKHLVDRFLRTGGLAALRDASAVPVSSVRLQAGGGDSAGGLRR